MIRHTRHSVETVRAKELQGSQTPISPSFSRHILASPHCYGTEERARAGAVSLAFQARALTTGFAWGVIGVRCRCGGVQAGALSGQLSGLRI